MCDGYLRLERRKGGRGTSVFLYLLRDVGKVYIHRSIKTVSVMFDREYIALG